MTRTGGPARRCSHGRTRRHRRSTTGLVALALGATACALVEAPATGSGARPTARPPAATTPTPTAPSPSADRTPEPSTTTPLVLAMHPTRPPVDVSRRQARALIAGRIKNWARLGEPDAPLRLVQRLSAVARDRNALAAVPASAVGPAVRVMTVAGRHPLRRPSAYPLHVPGPAPRRVVTVTVTGDIMLARRVGAAMAAAGDPAAALRPTAGRLARADLTIGNLESTLSRSGPPQQGGDSFGADPSVRRGLRLAGFDVLSLANNHVGDYGERALVQTVRRVRAAGIAPVGAGADLAAARRPVVLRRAGVRFGVLAFDAIGESPAAGRDSPGVRRLSMPPRTGPLDRAALASVARSVRSLQRRVDVVMVLPHWGDQYTNDPVREQHVVARRLVRAGADVVVGGHPHWVQGVELVRGRLVAHSLGNFVFDMDFSRETQEGVILELTFWRDELKAAEFVPVRIGADFAPRVVGPRAGEPILARMWATSGPPFSLGR